VKVILFSNTDWFLYNFRLHTAVGLRKAGYEVLLVSPDGEYVPRLVAAGFEWKPFEVTRRGINPFSELRTILRFRRLLKKEKPDILNNYTIKCVIYGSLAARFTGVSHVINTIPGLGYVFTDQPKAKLLRFFVEILYRIALKETTVIFINRDDMAQFIEKKLSQAEQVHLIESCGVDTVQFSPVSEFDGVPVVLFAGRLLKDKGIDEFVAAAREVNRDTQIARFVLVGNIDAGNPTGVTEKQISKWAKEGVVEYWGWQDDMTMVYRQSHIVCLPSYYREGVPKSLLEAAACEKPLIATDEPGCRSVVIDGETGLLIKTHDSHALAKAVDELIQSPEMRQKMGAAARKLVQERFSDEQVVQKTVALYHQVTNS
jgi:glycosyltransferase involved in cell wall biosynthesis